MTGLLGAIAGTVTLMLLEILINYLTPEEGPVFPTETKRT
jgi:hypothetical protein